MRTNNYTTKLHTTKDWAAQTPPKSRIDLRCSGRIHSYDMIVSCNYLTIRQCVMTTVEFESAEFKFYMWHRLISIEIWKSFFTSLNWKLSSSASGFLCFTIVTQWMSHMNQELLRFPGQTNSILFFRLQMILLLFSA